MVEEKVPWMSFWWDFTFFDTITATHSVFQGQGCCRSGDMPQTLFYFPRKILILVQTSFLHLALLEHHIPPFLLESTVIYITFQKVLIWNQLSLYMNSAFV